MGDKEHHPLTLHPAMILHQVAAIFPYGNASVQVVEGGLDIAKPDGKGHTIIANAAVVVYFDMEAATGGGS